MRSIWNPIAVQLAQRSKDENVDPIERLMAMVQINSMAEAGTLIVDVSIPDLAEALVSDTQPKYIWRNGARVKVKQ